MGSRGGDPYKRTSLLAHPPEKGPYRCKAAAVFARWVMSDADDDPAPADRAIKAAKTACRDLAEAHADADNAAIAGAAEQEHVTEFVDVVARALADGMNQPVGLYAATVAEEAQYYTKTDLKQQIKDKSEDYRGNGKQPLDEFVEERVKNVKIVKTTDHRQGAQFIWDFGTFQVETQSGEEGREHFDFTAFRDYIHESGGVNTAPPVKDRRGGEEWRDFMIEMLDQHGEERSTRGPRTRAVEALANKLRRLTGYGTPEGALDHTGVWVVREAESVPDWWGLLGATSRSEPRDLPETRVEQVRIHESLIKPVLSDADITRSALYHELDARGHTVPVMTGASMTKWVDGSKERFWCLTADLGTPRTYVSDPHAPDKVSPFFPERVVGAEADEAEPDASEPPESPGDNESPPASADGGEELSEDGSTGGFDSVGDTE